MSDVKNRVFLSGGFRSNWQETVINRLGQKFVFLNPRAHMIDAPALYSTWDIHFVRSCDILFAYMESTNPSGFGLAFELGIAYGLNKTIILVDEKSDSDADFARYFKMLHKSSGATFNRLDEGIDFLEKFSI